MFYGVAHSSEKLYENKKTFQKNHISYGLFACPLSCVQEALIVKLKNITVYDCTNFLDPDFRKVTLIRVSSSYHKKPL